MKKLVFLICLFVASSVSAQYDSDEKEMIASASDYRVGNSNVEIFRFEANNMSFWYKESEGNVQGEFKAGDAVCEIYGTYLGEGSYMASVWCNGKSRGVMYWDFSNDCTTIINKVDNKTYVGKVCRIN